MALTFKNGQVTFSINDAGPGGSGSTREVQGWIDSTGVFGLERRGTGKNAHYWATHLPSGLAIGLRFATRDAALAGLDKLAAVEAANWASPKPNVKAARDVYRELRDAPRPWASFYKDIPLERARVNDAGVIQ